MTVPTRAPRSDAAHATTPTPLRDILTPAALGRAALGWIAVSALALLAPALSSAAASAGALPATIAVIVVCAFGVVHQAERLAARLGDPLGTLVLTLSIVLIEVVLIVAVMLGPGDHAVVARDSVLAVSMIILNLVIGASLVVGGLRGHRMRANRAGTSAYVAMLVVLCTVAFALPALIGVGGSFTVPQAVIVAVLTVGLYAFFLHRQTGPQASDFREIGEKTHPAARGSLAAHRREIGIRLLLLGATMLPIVLLSPSLAALLDDALARVGAPAALAGVLIAAIVFLPEAITAVRAAAGGETQRVSNLCHGALVSTVGLTVPAVLVVGLITGHHAVFAADPTALVLLGVSLVLTIVTFTARRATPVHGATHLAVFALYTLTLFG